MVLEKETKVMMDLLGVNKDEKVLIITDANKRNIADAFFINISDYADVKMIEIPVGKVSGEEPPKEVASEMKKFDVIITPTTKSLSHTNARIEATKKGARIATMPGITMDVIERTFDVDYDAMIERGNKLKHVLEKGKKIRVVTELGTDITMSIEKRKVMSTKELCNKGDWGNLPSGEACIAPVEGTANGKYIVDASFAGIGKLKKPITIIVKDGFAVDIQGSEELKRILGNINDKNAYNIAELGIGINDKAKISGIVLEDEKVMGTAHIALGNSKGLGGKVDVKIHIDGVFLNPTIFIDDKKIMDGGKLIL